jgi:WD40 repeat protein
MLGLTRKWLTGEGINIVPLKAHDREVLCLDIQGTQLVTGSCDHALHVYDLNGLKHRRTLFTRQYGHHEWFVSDLSRVLHPPG